MSDDPQTPDQASDTQQAAAEPQTAPLPRVPGRSTERQKRTASGAFIRSIRNPRYNEIKGRGRPE